MILYLQSVDVWSGVWDPAFVTCRLLMFLVWGHTLSRKTITSLLGSDLKHMPPNVRGPKKELSEHCHSKLSSPLLLLPYGLPLHLAFCLLCSIHHLQKNYFSLSPFPAPFSNYMWNFHEQKPSFTVKNCPYSLNKYLCQKYWFQNSS